MVFWLSLNLFGRCSSDPKFGSAVSSGLGYCGFLLPLPPSDFSANPVQAPQICSSPQRHFSPSRLQCWHCPVPPQPTTRTKTCFQVPSRGRVFNWVCLLSLCSKLLTRWGSCAWLLGVQNPSMLFSSVFLFLSLFPFLNPPASSHIKIQEWKQHRAQYLLSKAITLHRSVNICSKKIAVYFFCCFVLMTPSTRLWDNHSRGY